MKHRSFAGWLIAFAACVFLMMMPVFADEYGYYDENGNYIEYDYFEDEEDDSSSGESQPETEFIPEEYYDPIQTNEITGWPQGILSCKHYQDRDCHGCAEVRQSG